MINDYTIFMSYSHFTDFFIYQCTTWFVGCVYSSIQVIRPNWLHQSLRQLSCSLMQHPLGPYIQYALLYSRASRFRAVSFGVSQTSFDFQLFFCFSQIFWGA